MIKQKIEEQYIKMKRGIPIIFDGKSENEHLTIKESLDHVDDDIMAKNILDKKYSTNIPDLLFDKLNKTNTPTSSMFDQKPEVSNLGAFHSASKKKMKEVFDVLDSQNMNDEDVRVKNQVKLHIGKVHDIIDDHLKTNFFSNGLRKKIDDHLEKIDDLYVRDLVRRHAQYAHGPYFNHDVIKSSDIKFEDLAETPKSIKEFVELKKKYKLTPDSEHLYKHEDGTQNIIMTKKGPRTLLGYVSDIPGYQEAKEAKRKAEKDEVDALHEHLSSIPNDIEHNLKAPILEYSGTLSGPINRHILRKHIRDPFLNQKEKHDYRDHSKDDMDQKVERISEGLNKNHSFDHDFHVYSGMASRVDIHKIVEENGNKITPMKLAPFTSTSISKSVAVSFANSKKPHSKEYEGIDKVHDVLKIHVPKDHTRGRYIDHDLTQNDGEYEYLLDKDHIVYVHPEPEIEFGGGGINRIWHAHIHKNGNEHD